MLLGAGEHRQAWGGSVAGGRAGLTVSSRDEGQGRPDEADVTRYRIWVACGEVSTSTGVRPTSVRSANIDSPRASNTGTTSTTSSSSAPDASAWRTVEAPPATSTTPSPAALLACFRAESKPSVTKKNVVPPAISIGSRPWWVSTNPGA